MRRIVVACAAAGTAALVVLACSTFEATNDAAPAEDANVESAANVDGAIDAPAADSVAPDVAAPRESFSTIAAGDRAACAVEKGALYCWGDNTYGALGQGPNTPCADGEQCRFTATRVAGFEGKTVVDVAAGEQVTCARTSDRELYCLGHNSYGALGVAPSVVAVGSSTPTPQRLPFGSVYEVALGYFTGCARVGADAGGTPLVCWGLDQFGQLGRGVWSPDDAALPAREPAPIAWDASIEEARLAVASMGCARAGSEIRCWGANTNGSLGHTPGNAGDTTSAFNAAVQVNATPSAVSGSFVTLDAVGSYASFARTAFTTQSWGTNYLAALGQGTVDGTPHPTPAPANALPADTVLVRGRHLHFCALTAGGDVHCWGVNAAGEIGGDGGTPCDSLTCRAMPTRVTGLPPIAEIAVGYFFTVARAKDGGLWAWGTNVYGTLGHAPGTEDDVDCAAIQYALPAGKCNALPRKLVLQP